MTQHLYIAGWGRSGTTMLGGLLGAIDGWTNLGELRYVWDRGLIDHQQCSCGEAFASCPFWTEALHATADDGARMAAVREQHLRLPTSLPTLLWRRQLPAEMVEYRDRTLDLVAQASSRTGAEVVVDSSKSVLDALLLASAPASTMKVIHIVRDPRAVAFSLMSERYQPDTGEKIPQKSALQSSARWLERNLLAEATLAKRVPTVRIRYEDVVTDPVGVVNDTLDTLGLDGAVTLDADGCMPTDNGHAVSGNPARFASRAVQLRRDDRWHDGLSARDRRLASLPAYGLMRRYGYGPVTSSTA